MKENWYEEFIESKGLMNEYNEFKERKINGCNGIAVNFNVMLGDGDDAKLSDIKKTAEAEYKKANEKYEAFTKEERDALVAINAKYNCSEILGFIANGSDSIDLVNAYLEGKL